ncbi:MAG: hypothetical protein J5819_05530 [Eubacterium sp.]|nr:hypothetical protein [Eubacterium sp.]
MNSITLLKTMMTSTSRRNVIKHSQDKSKRRAAAFSLTGNIVVAVLGAGIIGAYSFGTTYFGLGAMVPGIVASVITVLSLILTILKSNGYLYAFKGYDMLMAMPFSVRSIVVDRFLLMYLADMRWNALISLAALAGYAIAAKPSVWCFVSWIVLTLFLPLVPTAVSALIGFVIAAAGSHFRYKKQVQIALTFILILPLFFIRFFVQDVVENDQLENLIRESSKAVSGVSDAVPTAGWFEKAVLNGDILSFILLIVVSVAVFSVVVFFIAVTYRRINSRLMNSAAHKKVRSGAIAYKQKSVVKSIAFNDYRLITGSTVSAVNLGLGIVLCLLVGVVIPFVDIQSIVTAMAKGHQVDIAPFTLVWPVLIYFFVGMVPTTAPSPSLEGKNYWIIKSLPLNMMDVYKGKMLFNLMINLVPGWFAVLMGMISLRASWYEYILGMLMITVMCLFSTTYGMRCGIKHQKLDWENEIEVVKRGTAVTVYLLPNLFATLIMIGLVGACSIFIGGWAGALLVIVLYSPLALLCYMSIKRRASE